MKKYIIMILLLIITLTCVSATEDTSSDVIEGTSSVDDSIEDSTALDSQQEVVHHVNTSENLHEVLSQVNYYQPINNHTIELEEDLTIDADVNNEYMDIIINGNNHQLTVNNLKFSNANSVVLNNMVLELNTHIDNHVNLTLNNVTIKSVMLYDNITKTLSDNGITEFTDDNYERVSEIFYGVNTNHGNIQNYKNLYVNNSIFTKTMAHTGSAIYNHGYLSVDNTLFNDTLSVWGVVYSEGSLRVTNSKFTNNKQCAYLLHSDTGDITCINNSFENNYALYNSGVSGFASALVENCNFTNNTASSMNSINNNGNMTVVSCIFKDNSGDVIYNLGNLTVSACVFENNSNSYIVNNHYLYDGQTGEIIRIGNLTLVNNTFMGNSYDKLIYNGVNLTLLGNNIYDVSDVLNEDEPGYSIFEDIIYDSDTDEFNRSVSVESNNFIIDSEGQIDEILIGNQSNYVQYTPRYALITLDEINSGKIGETITISGYLTDGEGNPLNGPVNIISNYTNASVDTDDNGYFSYEYTPYVVVNYITFTYDKNPYINPCTISISFAVTDFIEGLDTNESEDTNITDGDLSDINDTTSESNVTEVNESEDNPSDDTQVPTDTNITDIPIDNPDITETNDTDVGLNDDVSDVDVTNGTDVYNNDTEDATNTTNVTDDVDINTTDDTDLEDNTNSTDIPIDNPDITETNDTDVDLNDDVSDVDVKNGTEDNGDITPVDESLNDTDIHDIDGEFGENNNITKIISPIVNDTKVDSSNYLPVGENNATNTNNNQINNITKIDSQNAINNNKYSSNSITKNMQKNVSGVIGSSQKNQNNEDVSASEENTQQEENNTDTNDNSTTSSANNPENNQQNNNKSNNTIPIALAAVALIAVIGAVIIKR